MAAATGEDCEEKNQMNGLILLLLAASALVPPQYHQYLEQGDLSRAMTLLSTEMRANGDNPQKQAACALELGHFHRDVCGDFLRAAAFYRRVVSYKLPPDHPLAKNSAAALKELQTLQTEHRELDSQLRLIIRRSSRNRREEEVEEDIQWLKEILKQHPSYYRLHEVHFALAVNYEKLQNFYRAYRALDTAMAVKPGIVFYLPVKFKRDKAHENFWVNTVKRATLATFWLLLIITALLFYSSRPWKWAGLRHVAVGLALLAIWWGIFHVSHAVSGWYFDKHVAPKVAHTAEDAEDKEFLYASPGSPGSETAEKLFLYGLVGVAAIFVFALGLRRFQRPSIRLIAGALFGLLLFTALSARYYMDVCHGQGEYAAGYLKLDSDDPEPFVLTKPLAYPDLETKNIRDPYVREWVLHYCPFTGETSP
jgi:tetratricopeptide (TPR) repeat protein